MAAIIDWGKMCIRFKYVEVFVKTKTGISTVFSFPSLNLIQLTATRTFFLASICIFILCYYFQVERIL